MHQQEQKNKNKRRTSEEAIESHKKVIRGSVEEQHMATHLVLELVELVRPDLLAHLQKKQRNGHALATILCILYPYRTKTGITAMLTRPSSPPAR